MLVYIIVHNSLSFPSPPLLHLFPSWRFVPLRLVLAGDTAVLLPHRHNSQVRTMDGGQGSGARGCIGQTPRRRLLPEGLPLLDHEIDQLKQEHQGNERLHKEEVERLIAQFRQEMEGIERKYERLMAEKEAEYRHQIGNLEMNKNKVIQNRQLCEAWRLQPDPRVLRLGMSVVPTACAGSQRQTSCLQPYQTLPPPPSACLSSATLYLNKVIDVANQRQAATSAVYHDAGMMQQNIDPQPVGQCIDMMPNYWLTSEAFLTSNFDQSWWWRRPQ
ncbi:hypothetical protein EJ110_NYTH47387 [Nymphaea thermarum]|nr:hypothetical protein EJ110_NYTH47387 [Nymphaea thermarum]